MKTNQVLYLLLGLIGVFIVIMLISTVFASYDLEYNFKDSIVVDNSTFNTELGFVTLRNTHFLPVRVQLENYGVCTDASVGRSYNNVFYTGADRIDYNNIFPEGDYTFVDLDVGESVTLDITSSIVRYNLKGEEQSSSIKELRIVKKSSGEYYADCSNPNNEIVKTIITNE